MGSMATCLLLLTAARAVFASDYASGLANGSYTPLMVRKGFWHYAILGGEDASLQACAAPPRNLVWQCKCFSWHLHPLQVQCE